MPSVLNGHHRRRQPLGPGNRGQRSFEGRHGDGYSDSCSEDDSCTSSIVGNREHYRGERRGTSQKGATPRSCHGSTPAGTPTASTPQRRRRSSSAGGSSVSRLGGGVAVQHLGASDLGTNDMTMMSIGEGTSGSRKQRGSKSGGAAASNSTPRGGGTDELDPKTGRRRKDKGGTNRGGRDDRDRERGMSSKASEASGYSEAASLVSSSAPSMRTPGRQSGGRDRRDGPLLEYMTASASDLGGIGASSSQATTPRGTGGKRSGRSGKDATPRSARSATPRRRGSSDVRRGGGAGAGGGRAGGQSQKEGGQLVDRAVRRSSSDAGNGTPNSEASSERARFQGEGRQGITYGYGNVGVTPYGHDDKYLRRQANNYEREKHEERRFPHQVAQTVGRAAGLGTLQQKTLRQQKSIVWGDSELALGQRGEDRVERLLQPPEMLDGRVISKDVPRYAPGICSLTHDTFKAPHPLDIMSAHTPVTAISRHGAEDCHSRRHFTDITKGQEVRDGTGLLNSWVKKSYIDHHQDELAKVRNEEDMRPRKDELRRSYSARAGAASAPVRQKGRKDNDMIPYDDIDGNTEPPSQGGRALASPVKSKAELMKAANALLPYSNHDRFYQAPPAEAYDLRIKVS